MTCNNSLLGLAGEPGGFIVAPTCAHKSTTARACSANPIVPLFADVVRELADRHIDADAIIEPATIAPPNPAHAELENETKSIALLEASDPKFKLYDEGRPASFASDEAASKAALDKGATYVVVAETLSYGALSESVSRLIDAKQAKTIERDVSWKAVSSGVETLFVNGFRVK